MKNLYLIFRFLCFFVVINFGCTKEEVSSVSPYLFTCKINGLEYKINGESKAFATLKTTDTYWIYGNDPDTGREMYVRVGVNQGLGTVQMKGTTQAGFIDNDKTNYHTNFNSGSGQITITEKTSTILKGSFSFIANTFSMPVKKAQVTGGEFYVLIK